VTILCCFEHLFTFW